MNTRNFLKRIDMDVKRNTIKYCINKAIKAHMNINNITPTGFHNKEVCDSYVDTITNNIFTKCIDGNGYNFQTFMNEMDVLDKSFYESMSFDIGDTGNPNDHIEDYRTILNSIITFSWLSTEDDEELEGYNLFMMKIIIGNMVNNINLDNVKHGITCTELYSEYISDIDIDVSGCIKLLNESTSRVV